MNTVLRIDIGRLLSRARYATPTGIDRVERAYVRYFLQSSRAVQFITSVPGLGDRILPHLSVARFLDRLEQQWQSGIANLGWAEVVKLWLSSVRMNAHARAITVMPSHLHLDNAHRLAKRRGNGALVLFVHDCIPSDYPEYARAGGAAKHRLRLENAARFADAILVNSQDTADRLTRYASPDKALPPLSVAHIGIDRLPGVSARSNNGAPYFVILGTIEPRKNHLLLLHIWRHWAQSEMRDIPQLIVAGKRGWENENIIDLLDRCTALRGRVIEKQNLGDAELGSLLRGARALLMPSFAEGFGMPIAEALAAGVPVIASDLPVFREMAGDVPDYRDPLDGAGWADAILSYAASDSVLRQQQLERMRHWQPTEWAAHFAVLEDRIDRLLL